VNKNIIKNRYRAIERMHKALNIKHDLNHISACIKMGTWDPVKYLSHTKRWYAVMSKYDQGIMVELEHVNSMAALVQFIHQSDGDLNVAFEKFKNGEELEPGLMEKYMS